MSLIDIFSNAVGGGILGGLLHSVTSWIETRQKISLIKAESEAAEKSEAWKAFSASQANTQPLQIPAGASPWVVNLYLCVDAARQLTRPALTWAAVAIVAGVYWKSTPEARTALAPEILFGSFTAVFWWFGARYAKAR